MISMVLVILVVFVFLRSLRTTLIPSVAVPVSLIGTFGVMYLLRLQPGQFVADGADDFDRVRGGRRDRGDREHHRATWKQGMSPLEAALKGAQEIGFTVLTISISLVAVFIPLLLMGGIVGRLFREFAVTLSVAIAVSMVVSLTTTPMMCAHLLREHERRTAGSIEPASAAFNWMVGFVRADADGGAAASASSRCWCCWRPSRSNVYLFMRVPKGFFPQQDNGRMHGRDSGGPGHFLPGDGRMLLQHGQYRAGGPGGRHVNGFTGGGSGGTQHGAHVHLAEAAGASGRSAADQIIARLRPQAGRGCRARRCILQAAQDVRVGGRHRATRSISTPCAATICRI